MARHRNIQAPPAGRATLPLTEGQERRWLAALPQESREEALDRARQTMPWGWSAIAVPVLCRGRWTFTISPRAAS